MKMFKCISVIMVILFVCIISNSLLGSAKAQDAEMDYYLVDGEKITLQVSEEYSAIKMKHSASEDKEKTELFNASVRSLGTVEQVEHENLFKQYGIVLVRSKDEEGSSSFRTATRSLSAREEVESENPVYKVGNVNQLLVNEFIVQFKPDVSAEKISESLKIKSVEVVEKHKKIKNRYILKFSDKSAKEALGASNEYCQDPLVEFSEPNFIRIYPKRPKIEKPDFKRESTMTPSPSVTPGDPLYSNQWGLNNAGSPGVSDADIDAPEAWNIETGTGIVVAILDEGVDIDHEDLKAKIVTPYDATDGDNDQQPNAWDGHGTSCAGIAGAVHNNLGVAGIGLDVKILPVRIAYSDQAGGGWITSNSIIEDGIRTAVDRGAHVLSNSWGGGSVSSTINSAIDYAISQNRVVVIAAGNDAGPVSYPANLSLSKDVIAVSATNEWDQFKTPTSDDGESWWGSNFGPEITVAAPGVHIYTTDISGTIGYSNDDYVSNFNGTSSSTPFVAGTAALILSQHPTWSPGQVRDQLQVTADDLGPAGQDDQFGHGRINANRALGGLAPIPPVTPVPQPPATCGFVNHTVDHNISQTFFNLAMLFSAILLFSLFQIIRRTKKLLLNN